MKIKILPFTLSVTLIFSSLLLHAQQEQTNDLVPFKKGNKWGIVHRDGTEFYPAVFDSLLIKANKTYYNADLLDLFLNERYGDSVLPVIYKQQKYFLTKSKRLVTKVPSIPEAKIKKQRELRPGEVAVVKQEEVTEASISLANAVPVKEASDTRESYLQTPSGKKILVKEEEDEKSNRVYQFYFNGVHKPEFDCKNLTLSPKEAIRNVYSGAIVGDGLNDGYLDFEKEKLTVPLKYLLLEFSTQWDNFLISSKDGIVTKEGKTIGRKFKHIEQLDFEYETTPKVLIVNTGDYHYHFYFPEQDSLGKEAFDYLGEYYCGFYPFSKTRPYFHAKRDRKEGIFTFPGANAVVLNYDDVECKSDVITVIKMSGKTGFMISGFEPSIIMPYYDQLIRFYETSINSIDGSPYYLFYVKKGGKTFYVDNSGKEFIAK